MNIGFLGAALMTAVGLLASETHVKSIPLISIHKNLVFQAGSHMTEVLHTDLELVALYSEDFANQYQKAKSFAALAPKACLMDLRILLERLTADLANSFQISREKNRSTILFNSFENQKV